MLNKNIIRPLFTRFYDFFIKTLDKSDPKGYTVYILYTPWL